MTTSTPPAQPSTLFLLSFPDPQPGPAFEQALPCPGFHPQGPTAQPQTHPSPLHSQLWVQALHFPPAFLASVLCAPHIKPSPWSPRPPSLPGRFLLPRHRLLGGGPGAGPRASPFSTAGWCCCAHSPGSSPCSSGRGPCSHPAPGTSLCSR